ncbi:hypothetical protein LTR08_008802 [Meristemomyces frigidus]|nr:hypothetical protein LTR08_008802 [Meristemomyces frigidus]
MPERRQTCRQLPIKPSSVAEEAYMSLGSALSSFLRATSVEELRRGTGASSLMTACLRRIPAYVDLEEECSGKTGDALFDDVDKAPDSIYDDLEALGTAQGSGWAGLREVVRADGLYRIRDAIFAGLLPMRTVEALVRICGAEGAVAEGQQLLCAALEARISGRKVALPELLSMAEKYACGAVVLRMLGSLLHRGIVAVWDLSAYKEMWPVVFKAFALPRDRPEAADFLRIYMLAAGETGSTRIPTTGTEEAHRDLKSAVVLLTGLAACSCNDNEGPNGSLGSSLSRIATYAVLARHGTSPVPKDIVAERLDGGDLLSSFVLSSLALEIGEIPSISTVQHLNPQASAEIIAETRGQKDADTATARSQHSHECFLSDVALCIARWDREAGDAFLVSTTRRLLRITETFTSPPATVAVESLAISSAKAYAEVRGDKASVIFAEEIEDMVLHGAQLSTLRTPGGMRLKQDRYRWEEGLCEWIARTPFSVASEGTGVAHVHPSVIDTTPGAAIARKFPASVLSAATVFTCVGDTTATQQAQRPGKRTAVALDGASTTKQHVPRRKKLCLKQRSLPVPPVLVKTDNFDTLGSSTEEIDELAFSAKKVRKPQGKAFGPKPVRKAMKLQRKPSQLASLKRASSGSSGWSTLDDSGDELGIESGDELGM